MHNHLLQLNPLSRALVLGLISWYLTPISFAAVPDDFKTDEYYASGTLDLINAAGAYALGYTGAGVSIGVTDTQIDSRHPELLGKSYNFNSVTLSEEETHGTHVAGLIAAKRNGLGMHGTAFDASLVSGAFLSVDSFDWDGFFAAFPEIRIVNCSWGLSEYISNFDENNTPFGIKELKGQLAKDSDFSFIAKHMAENPQMLYIFASGNDGMYDPGLGGASIPWIMGNGNCNNLLSVGSLSGANIDRSDSGKLQLGPAAVSSFSNLAYTNSLYTVFAPGDQVLSLQASTNGYMYDSGTSMAAPVVSGVAALVQQAYPWMTGKQLADAILTTADNDFDAPNFTLQWQMANEHITFIIIEDAANPLDVNKIKNDKEALHDLLDAYYNDAGVSLLPKKYAEYYLKNDDYDVITLTKEEVFGQGIVNAAKAVQGIARLDVNRLSQNNIYTVPDLNEKYALEVFDTGSYYAVFNNDISERKWADKYHHAEYQAENGNDTSLALKSLHAGIIKEGSGTLVLSGENTYEGASLVKEGTLAVAKRPDGSGGMLTKSPVVVYENGTLKGDGSISKVINKGTVIPGFSDSKLHIDEYTQEENGLLNIIVNSKGEHTALNTNNASLNGTINFQLQQGEFYANGNTLTVDSYLNSQEITGSFKEISSLCDSLTLKISASPEDAAVSSAVKLYVSRDNNAYSRLAQNKAAAATGKALAKLADETVSDIPQLFGSLDWLSTASEISDALTSISAEAYNLNTKASIALQHDISSRLLDRQLDFFRTKPYVSEDWQFWLTPFTYNTNFSSVSGVPGCDSTSYGLLSGGQYALSSELTTGFHLVINKTDVNGKESINSSAEMTSFQAGAQLLYTPKQYAGTYLSAQARLGLEHGSLDRSIAFKDYRHDTHSSYDAFIGSALFGAGKDFVFEQSGHKFSFGPIAFFDYTFLKRPKISENGRGSASLTVADDYYDSLLFYLGLKAAWLSPLKDDLRSSLAFTAAWQHELLNEDLSTDAYFSGHKNYSFITTSDKPENDALLLKGSFSLQHANGVFVELEAGGICCNADFSSFGAALDIGYRF